MLDSKTLQRTVCPVCNQPAPIRADGTVGDHDQFPGGGFIISLRCDGIGKRTDKLKRVS